MHYQDFFGQITMRTQVGRDHWPVKSFCSPHAMPVEELRVLYNVITSDDAPPLFRKLTDAEFAEVQKENGIMPQPTEPAPTTQSLEDTPTPAIPSTGEGSSSQSGGGSGAPVASKPVKRNPTTGAIQRKVRWDAGMTLAQKAMVKKARQEEEEAVRRRKLAEGVVSSGSKRGRGRGRGRGVRGSRGGRVGGQDRQGQGDNGGVGEPSVSN